jgi:isoquinoline 1-oxidoreductase subunit beta
MIQSNKPIKRRSFLKVTAMASGGLMLQFSWLSSIAQDSTKVKETIVKKPNELNAYITITPDNVIKIINPNPDFGQNVMTSLPMIIAEELDANWATVVVEMGTHNEKLGPQFSGGSNSVKMYWKPLREAGATARYMLMQAVAENWGVPIEEVTTKDSMLYHEKTGKSVTYGSVAVKAATLPVPKDVKLKNVNDFKIVGYSQKNVEGKKIITGTPLFSMDYKQEGMLIAMIEHPPAFGMKIKSFDASQTLTMPGITDVFKLTLFEEGSELAGFDTRSFNEILVVVGKTTWQVTEGRKKLITSWEVAGERKEKVTAWGKTEEVFTPSDLESTSSQLQKMKEYAAKPAEQLRKDGDPETAFANAAQIIERTYTAPFLAHNCMEPTNFFAHVTKEKALLVGALQGPNWVMPTLEKILNLPAKKIEIKITRMGGGFGRRAYNHSLVEAALISKKVNAPVKLIYTREDDMTYGIYRPMYTATYRAALDENKNLTALYIKGGGIPEHPIHENRFPAGAVDNYLAEGWKIPSNITIGAYRAPRSNFNAAAEQSFLDELAEIIGKDPIAFRLELLKKAKEKPVGKGNDYDAERYAAVLELVKEKSGWGNAENAKYSRGVSAYFCHNSYAAHVVDMVIKNGEPYVERVFSAIDCGIVINPDAASNMVEGAVIDGISNAFFSGLTHIDGVGQQANFNKYRIIRMHETPKKIDVYFVDNDIDPTGLGEPPFPPVFGAVANALYKLQGKRKYNQPYASSLLDSIKS